MIEALRREAPWGVLLALGVAVAAFALMRSPVLALALFPALVGVGLLVWKPAYGLPVLLVSILISDGFPLGVSVIVPLTFSKLAMGGMLGVWLLHSAAVRRWPVRPKMWLLAFVAMWLMMILGLTWAPHLGNQAKEYLIGFGTLTVLVVTIDEIANVEDMRSVLLLLALGWLVTIGLSIPFGFELDVIPVRHLGFGKNPNSWALTVVLGLGPSVAVFENQRGWWARLATLAAIAIASVAVLMTVSRSGFVALVAVVPFIAHIMWRRRAFAALALVAVVVAVVVSVDLGEVWGRFDSLFDADEFEMDGSIRDRTIVQDFAVNAFLDHPLLGIGTGAFQEEAELASAGQAGLSSHNTYLQVLAEDGVFGGVVFMGFSITIAWSMALAWIRERSPRFRRVTAGLIGSLVAFWVMMGAMNGLTFAAAFFFLGLSLAWSRLAALPSETLERHGLA